MSRLTVPESIRETAGKVDVRRSTGGSAPSVTWIIEISSQVIFSTSAAVHFELLVGRDEKSIELGFSALTSHSVATPGQVEDHQQSKRSKDGQHSAVQPKGVFSHAVDLVVDDTVSLWNKPALPEWSDEGKDRGERESYPDPGEEDVVSPADGNHKAGPANDSKAKETKLKKRKRVHLVVLTHGLHSNLGSDLLYLKESIDAAAKQAREDSRKRKQRQRAGKSETSRNNQGSTESGNQKHANEEPAASASTAPLPGGQNNLEAEADIDEDDEEEVIVRGFGGNATRTERGIQYLGKRLAKWVLSMTYPDQPFLPAKQPVRKKISRVFTGENSQDARTGPPQHNHSSIHRPAKKPNNLAYKITSISFISHSLGGLTQTYAIAYIHKHSPHFFEEIKPINFVAMAAPFLGLSNENPLYVKFALDFGLVGRTGQDLGLTWRAPTMVRSGWGAMIGGIGADRQRAHKQPDPGSKPLLRILPTGHTHQVLKLFRNRTVYSNVVNDGIVPLRTSCLLFLDWSGLGRVEKARRENGLVGTMAGWGWAELTGANSTSKGRLRAEHDSEAWSHSDVSADEGSATVQERGERAEVPQPEENAVRDDTTAEGKEQSKPHKMADDLEVRFQDEDYDATKAKESSPQQPTHPLSGFLSIFRPNPQKDHHHSPKHTKIYKRSQTTRNESDDVISQSSESSSSQRNSAPAKRPGNVRGDSVIDDPEDVFAPPKTTIFESAGDILNPPLPSKEFLIDPKSRPRTIFHDRVYHPEDIPPPPKKKRTGLKRSISSELRNGPSRSSTIYGEESDQTPDMSGMKVEEKIARAYHHGLSWRKVLVRLEPDAHNNMVVRRMFSNAYGWPVIKHLVDTHFADTYTATTADANEPSDERAKPMGEALGDHGEEVKSRAHDRMTRTNSEKNEAKDRVPNLRSPENHSVNSSFSRPTISREDSAQWDDALFEGTDDDDDMETPVDARSRRFSDTRHDNSAKATSEADSLTRSSRSLNSNLGGERKPVLAARHPGATTSVGLGKSVEEQLSTPGRPRRRTLELEGQRGGSLSEDVQKIRISE